MFNYETEKILKNILVRLRRNRGSNLLSPAEHQIINRFLDEASSDLFGIYLFDGEQKPFSQMTSRNYESFIQHYEEYRSCDPILHKVLRHGSISESSEVLGNSGWERHPLCRFMSDWELKHSLQAPIKLNGRVMGTVNLARRLEKGKFRPREVTWIWKISQAVSLLYENIEPEADTESLPDPAGPLWSQGEKELVLLTDGNGHILSQNLNAPDRNYDPCLWEALMHAIGNNLRLLQGENKMVATKTINAPPPDVEQITAITSRIPSLENQFVSTIIGLSVIAPQIHLNLNQLPPRTKCVAELLLRGYSNKMIARELDISENTVKDHIRKIYGRFGVSNKTEFAWLVNSPLKIN